MSNINTLLRTNEKRLVVSDLDYRKKRYSKGLVFLTDYVYNIFSFTTYPLRDLPNMILMMTQPQVRLRKFSLPVNKNAA